jgi:hypothetical protein
MATVDHSPNWLSFYHHLSKETGNAKITFESDLASFNNSCEEYTGNKTKLWNLIVENSPCRVLLLPTTRKGLINITHSCVKNDKQEDGLFIIGIHGPAFSSPWKECLVKDVVTPLSNPPRLVLPPKFPHSNRCSPSATLTSFQA